MGDGSAVVDGAAAEPAGGSALAARGSAAAGGASVVGGGAEAVGVGVAVGKAVVPAGASGSTPGGLSDGGSPIGRYGANVGGGCAFAVSTMKLRHTSPGTVPPEIGVPFAVRMGEFMSVPIQTVVATSG
ncbi:hypothetical protein ACFQV8_17215 [Pseudonocardia benzenivorans]